MYNGDNNVTVFDKGNANCRLTVTTSGEIRVKLGHDVPDYDKKAIANELFNRGRNIFNKGNLTKTYRKTYYYNKLKYSIISNCESYVHTTITDKYGTTVTEDKSVDKREQIGEKLFGLFTQSDFTRQDLSVATGIPEWKINRIFAGDEDFTIYEITHIAGALGYDFSIVFQE